MRVPAACGAAHAADAGAAGIEFQQGSADAEKFAAMLKDSFPDRFKKARRLLTAWACLAFAHSSASAQVRFPGSAGYGVKAVSREGTERLMEAAITYALDNKSKSVTLVHKGAVPARARSGMFLTVSCRQHHEEHRGRLPRLGLQAGAE